MAYGSEMLNAVNDIKTALGGTDDGGIEYGSELLNTVVDIKTLVENGGGGGGGLPPVSGTDNGKVLTVVDGAWAAASGGGGGGLLVHLIFPETPEDPSTLDKNWNEINAAVQSGVMPVFMDEGGGMLTCIEVFSEDNEYDVALVTFDTVEPRTMVFFADSATGVLTYTP